MVPLPNWSKTLDPNSCVMDPNKLNLDPDFEFWPTLNPDPGYCY